MTSFKSFKHHNVIIISASHNSIVIAKTYIQFNSLINILIINEGKSISSVWSTKRIYPSLIFEMPTPLTNFTDFDMTKEIGAKL